MKSLGYLNGMLRDIWELRNWANEEMQKGQRVKGSHIAKVADRIESKFNRYQSGSFLQYDPLITPRPPLLR